MVSAPVRSESETGVGEVRSSPDQVWPLVLRFPESMPLTDELLLRISEENDWWRFERNADGDLEIMSPASNESEEASAEIARQLGNWIREHAGGMLQGSNGGFDLPSGANRSPDAAWVSKERLATLSREERTQAFKPITPDFLVEVRSPGQELSQQQKKMREWIGGGAQLAWLVDPESETVHIYRPDGSIEVVQRPDELSAEPTCPGLTISFQFVWNLQSQADLTD